MTSKELREKRAPLATRIREMADKMNADGYKQSAEDDANWKQLNDDYDGMSRSIDLAERAERVEAEQAAPNVPPGGQRNKPPGREDVDSRNNPGERNNPDGDGNRTDDDEDRDAFAGTDAAGPATRLRGGTAEQQVHAMVAWFRHQCGYEITKRQEESVKACRVNLRARYLDLPIRRRAPKTEQEVRALSAVTGASGAYTIPEGFVNNLELAMLQFGGVRNVADILRTASGNPLPWPTSNDTSNTGELVGENTAVANADPAFGQMVLNAYKYSSKMIKVPVELLEDSAFDLPAVLGQMMGERLGRITATHYTTGNAASKPNGIVTASTLGVTTASGTAIKADEIIDLAHSVDPSYRQNPGTGYMMHDSILQYIRKLKDGQGQYLYQPNNQQGQPDRIHGYRFTINQDMTGTTSNVPVTATKTMLFGDMSRYKIRDVSVIRIRRLVERFADTDQEGFVAFMRTDGNLLDAGTHPVKHLLQA